jgi:hypothetical protein
VRYSQFTFGQLLVARSSRNPYRFDNVAAEGQPIHNRDEHIVGEAVFHPSPAAVAPVPNAISK